MEKKNQTINLIKNLLTQTRDGEENRMILKENPSDSSDPSNLRWRKAFIFYYKKDASNTQKKALFRFVKEMRMKHRDKNNI